MDSMRETTQAPARSQVPARVHVFTFVLLLWLAGYALTRLGGEPYPALTQPGFGYVADKGGQIHWTDIEYVVTLDDGTTHPVDYRDFYADAGEKAEYIATHVIAPDTVDDPQLVAWVRGRLAGMDLDGVPVRLTVQTRAVTFDSDSLTRQQRAEPKTWAVVELQT